MSSWVWGNIAFGGLIGFLVDLVSGGAYNVDPEYVDLALTETAKDVTKREPLTSQRDEPGYFFREPQALPSVHSDGQPGKGVTLENDQRGISDVLPRR